MSTSLKWTFHGERMGVTAFARSVRDKSVTRPAITQSTGYPAADPNTPDAFGAAMQGKF